MKNEIYQINVVDYLDTVEPLIETKVGKEMCRRFWHHLLGNDNHIACGVILRPSWEYVYSVISDVKGWHKKQLEWINKNMKGKRHEEDKKVFLEKLEEDRTAREKLKACLPDIKSVIDEFEKKDVYYRFFW